ncbi:MAG: 30S ribosomal protein S1 [Gammaproteobacteria bacterium]
MNESFEKLFEESMPGTLMRPGSLVKAEVIKVANGYVTLYTPGSKSEGVVPLEQFLADPEIKIGELFDVVFEGIEADGQTRLSREKAKRQEEWNILKEALEEGTTIKGRLGARVKGGFTVEVGAIRAFLPGSLLGLRPGAAMDAAIAEMEGQELDFKVIKLDQKRNNIVVSRRSMSDTENSAERKALLEALQEGQMVEGVVKNLMEYGAFVDLGGVDGLLHNTDMAWDRIKHASEILKVGQTVTVKVLKYDRDRGRVSLGLKQMSEDPWENIARRYPKGTRLFGKISNIADYGCFVKLESGVEGLVHVSEMDWTSKNVHPNKLVHPGQEVEVMVLEIDTERRRISLGLKQCQSNPWDTFAATHKKGDQITGKIKSITDFGLFIGLDGGIDGLVHLSDISWNNASEEALKQYKKGDDVTALVVSVDPERERISLSIKQIEQDPGTSGAGQHAKGSIVVVKVTEVDTKGAKVELADGTEGYIRVGELSRERVEDARTLVSVGHEIEAKLMGVDRKTRILNLSVKAKDTQEEAQALENYNRNSDSDSGNMTLGDLFKSKIEK